MVDASISLKIIKDQERLIDIGVANTNQKGIITIYLSALPLTDKILLISIVSNRHFFRIPSIWMRDFLRESSYSVL
jgi:hypothetical protein